MELRDLEYFAVIAEHRNLGLAAEELGLSQPALSKSLRRLEEAVEAKVVKRTPRGVELTVEGNALLTHVRQLRLSLRDVAREVADLGRGQSGHLRIGAAPGPADYLLPTVCGIVLKSAPKVTLTLTVATNPVLVPLLRSGELDLMISGMAKLPYDDIVQEHLIDDEFVVFAARNHPLGTRQRVTLDDVAKERWAFASPDDLAWKLVHQAFDAHSLAPPRVSMIATFLQIRMQAVAVSDLLSCTAGPSLRQAASHFGLREIAVRDLQMHRRVAVGYRKSAYLSPAARRFIQTLRTTATQIAGK